MYQARTVKLGYSPVLDLSFLNKYGRIASALIALALGPTPLLYGQQSILSTGSWFKFAIEKNGVYKIDRDLLKKAGLDLSSVDPRKIKIYGNEGGMLPQANSATRPSDLAELAIYIKGEEDGTFNADDFILFYAEGPDHVAFNASRNIYSYEHNLYDTKNYVFLTFGGSNGKRIGTSENLAGSFPVIREYNDFAYHEVDQYNALKSGREWFGERFDAANEYTLKWEIGGIADSGDVTVVSAVMAQSFSTSSFKLFFNNNLIGEQPVSPIPNLQYAAKGKTRIDTLTIPASTLSVASRTTQALTYQYNKTGSGQATGYIDFVLLNFLRKLSLYNDQTVFTSSASLNNNASTFEVSGVNSNTTIWDITDNSSPKLQSFSLTDGKALFATETSALKTFIVFNTKTPSPEFVKKVPNQNLHNLSTPNLVIVTNPLFKEEALRLAQHRQQHTGWNVAVVTTDEIFNEFSSGRQDVTAIRDFTKYLYDKDQDALKALLLFGRSSYDYKDRVYNNTNYVPTYESRNSLHPLETYSSDDYFGFLEDSEGTWYEDSPEYHSLDIGVGRLPVKTVEEAKNVVDKIIYYETNPNTLGQWRNRITFVADDGDVGVHQKQADELADFVDTNHPEYNVKKIYLDAFRQILKPSGESAPDVNKNIVESIDRGSLIINYTGHGAEKLWAQERIFDDFVVEKLTNKNFPLFVTATCEFGRQDDPAQISSAELSVLHKDGGAIGMVSTARPVNSSTNFELNKAFYNALFEREDNQSLTLGEIFSRTKNNSISGVANRNFSLIGDPSLTLVFPEKQIRVTSIKTNETTDTLKALSHVIVHGEIVDDNQEKLSNFSGTVQAVLYDKQTDFTTLGNENPPFNFKEWYNAIFRGMAEVKEGEFELEFIVPKNIAYQLGQGKLSLYAYDKNTFTDAGSATLDFVVGKSESSPGTDATSPGISLYMGDTTFINGGAIQPSTTLIARLFDNNGINISSYGIGNSIIATLDDSATFVLNDYYESAMNDFTRGWIYFPMKDLPAGRHTIVLKAWDTFNNPGEASIDFMVTAGENLTIETFGNYPNPFSGKTMLFFTHNRSGDDLQALISIVDVMGNVLKTGEITLLSSSYYVNLMEFDAEDNIGKKLKPGLYLARLAVRSLSNGSKNEQVAKLIILN